MFHTDFWGLRPMDLSLFDGAAGAAGGEGEGQGETQAAVPAPTRRGKPGETIKYGKQETAASDAAEPAAGVQDQAETPQDKGKAFQELIAGEYKDEYTRETQRIVNRRFAETKALQDQVAKSQPVLDLLMQRYKITDGDMGKLQKAVESDDAYWSQAADEAGMSVEQYKAFQKLQRDNAMLLRAQKQVQNRQNANQQAQKWVREAEAVKQQFPKFDLGAELKNPAFVSMLRSGTPVEHAYKVIHFDSLVADAKNVTAAQTEKTVVDNIRAKGARPAENGTAAQSAFTVKDDVSKLSKKDRAEIAKRAARGEKIAF
ncbi:MAG: hypothetical protein LUF80_00585 [Oscillospiraceae bacterium]|nr:hypothetical protein [Oscillospiraceae bacterium]